MADDYDRLFPRDPRNPVYARYEKLDPTDFTLEVMGGTDMVKLKEQLRIAQSRWQAEKSPDVKATLYITILAIQERIEELANKSLRTAAGFGEDAIRLRGDLAHIALETIPKGGKIADQAIIDELELAISAEPDQTAA